MTKVNRNQSTNPSHILVSPVPSTTTATMSALPSQAPISQPSQGTAAAEHQDNLEIQKRKQTLCPKAKLRIHLDDITHPAIQKITQVLPLSTLIEEAIANVQAHLYTPPKHSETQTEVAPPQHPIPSPNHPLKLQPQEVRSVTLILRPMEGVAYTTGTDLDEAHKEIHLSLDYLLARIKQFYRTEDVSALPNSEAGDKAFIHEVRGVVTHEMVHAFQHNGKSSCPGGLVEGIADYVRMKAGLGAAHWNPWPAGKRTRGEKWDEGYQKSAWFLEWVEDTVGGVGSIGRLNEAMRKEEWDDGKIWERVMGKSVKDCWKRYEDDWDGLNKKHESQHGHR